jgi:hypothetical protein
MTLSELKLLIHYENVILVAYLLWQYCEKIFPLTSVLHYYYENLFTHLLSNAVASSYAKRMLRIWNAEDILKKHHSISKFNYVWNMHMLITSEDFNFIFLELVESSTVHLQ